MPGIHKVCQTPTSVTMRQLEDLWSLLTWPQQPLPVLDVGCGPGDIAAKFLAPRVPEGTKIVACDARPDWLQHARQHNAVPDVIDHQLFDVEAAGLEQSAVWQRAPYCKVFALLLAQEVAHNRQAIRNIHKLLAPGGEAIFTAIPQIRLWQMCEELIDEPGWRRCVQDLQRSVFPNIPPEDPFGRMKQLLRAEGFHIVHAWTGPVQVAVTLQEEIGQILASLRKSLNRISYSLLKEFTDDPLFRIFQNETGRGNIFPGERRVVPCTSTVIVGRKQ